MDGYIHSPVLAQDFFLHYESWLKNCYISMGGSLGDFKWRACDVAEAM